MRSPAICLSAAALIATTVEAQAPSSAGAVQCMGSIRAFEVELDRRQSTVGVVWLRTQKGLLAMFAGVPRSAEERTGSLADIRVCAQYGISGSVRPRVPARP